jgi:hypothetical protein
MTREDLAVMCSTSRVRHAGPLATLCSRGRIRRTARPYRRMLGQRAAQPPVVVEERARRSYRAGGTGVSFLIFIMHSGESARTA